MTELEGQPETTGRASRSLGRLIRQRRNEHGWSQEKLAQEMSRDEGLRWYQSTVNRVETGGRTVTWDEAVALAIILDFDLDKASGAAGAKHALAVYRQQRAQIEAALADYQQRWAAFTAEYGELTDSELDAVEAGQITLDELKVRHQASKGRKR